MAATDYSPATASRGLTSWLIRHKASLVCSCNQTGELFFVGASAEGGPVFTRAQFSRAMGIAAFSQRIFLAARTQIWRLENIVKPGHVASERFDRVYAPRSALITGDIDTHEIGLDASGRVVFTNTAYSCLAGPSLTHAFKAIWKPKFISKLVPEDRCHLNGMAMEDGKARAVSVCSMTDVVDGWRDRRADGGAVIDVDTGAVLTDGLSMPHSPRFYRGALWVLNSGSGHLLRIDPQNNRREDVIFAPGFLRGLAFHGNYAVITISLPKSGRLDGLDLARNIARGGAEPWCGVLIVDLKHGAIVEWLRFGEVIPQLFDVAVLPQMRSPMAVSPESAELQETINFEEKSAS